jgi:hypothetical protein
MNTITFVLLLLLLLLPLAVSNCGALCGLTVTLTSLLQSFPGLWFNMLFTAC